MNQAVEQFVDPVVIQATEAAAEAVPSEQEAAVAEVMVSKPEMTFLTSSGATILLEQALNERLIALGQDAGYVWINGSQCLLKHCVEAGTINEAAAEYLKDTETVLSNLQSDK